MSIDIRKEKCIGCKKCLTVCPGSLIKFGEDEKAYIKYPKDCWGCSSCVKECKFDAISLYLGADIGGMGSKLTTKVEGDIVHWTITKSNEEVFIININPKDSNQY
jgi:adenylylsulfate reductase subunit B